MKKRPTNKYALGSSGIPSPYESFNDYNIMLANTEAQAQSNKGAAVAGMVGGILQQGLSMLGSAYTGGAGAGAGVTAPPSGATPPINGGINYSVPTASTLTNKYLKALGDESLQTDAEVEGGEAFETPQGKTGTFEGPSHEQGGIDVEVNKDIPEGTKIYSDRLKKEGKTMAERKESRERTQKNLMALLEKSPNKAMKNSVLRRMKSLEHQDMADLQHQEMVSSLATATRAFQFAWGTGYRGIPKYADGTGPDGIKYAKGYNQGMFTPYFNAFTQLNNNAPFDLGAFQDWLGVDKTNSGYGKMLGPSSYSLAQKKNLNDIYNADIANTGEGTMSDTDLTNALATGFKADQDAGLIPTYDATTPAPATNESKILDFASTYIPKVGDVVGLIGNYMAGKKGLAAEQRGRDFTHTNVYDRIGEDAMKSFDAAELGLLGTQAQELLNAKTIARSGKIGARNSARGINTARATDLAYDIAEGKSANQIMQKTAEMRSDLLTKKAGVQFQADTLKGKGRYEAEMANEAAQDAYYTALGLENQNAAKAVQQTGKDLNQIAMNPIYLEMLNNLGTYAGITQGGKVIKKPGLKTTTKTT